MKEIIDKQHHSSNLKLILKSTKRQWWANSSAGKAHIMLCMSAFTACIFLHHVHSWCPWRSGEGFRSLGASVTGLQVIGVEIKLRTSRKAANTLNHWAVSLSPPPHTHARTHLPSKLRVYFTSMIAWVQSLSAKRLVKRDILVIPAWKRQRQTDPWASRDKQPCLLVLDQ